MIPNQTLVEFIYCIVEIFSEESIIVMKNFLILGEIGDISDFVSYFMEKLITHHFLTI